MKTQGERMLLVKVVRKGSCTLVRKKGRLVRECSRESSNRSEGEELDRKSQQEKPDSKLLRE